MSCVNKSNKKIRDASQKIIRLGLFIFHLFLGRFLSVPGGCDDSEEHSDEQDEESVEEELEDRDRLLELPLLPEELEL